MVVKEEEFLDVSMLFRRYQYIYICFITVNACVVTKVNKNTSSVFQVSQVFMKSLDMLKISKNLLN